MTTFVDKRIGELSDLLDQHGFGMTSVEVRDDMDRPRRLVVELIDTRVIRGQEAHHE